MLFSCIKGENLKLKRSFIWIAFFLLPLIPAFMGMNNYLNNRGILTNDWYSLWTQETLFYSNFFFAPMAAIYCAYLWRVENFNHNRNSLMTMPVSVTCIFMGKLLSAFFVVILTQLWVGVLFLITGKMAGLPGLPSLLILSWLMRGLLGALTVTALQCVLSMCLQSFALPVGIAALGSITGLIAMNTKAGYFYPYSLMIFGMNANKSDDILGNTLTLFLGSSIFYTILFTVIGILILKKRDVKA